jgi:hypothetical protein
MGGLRQPAERKRTFGLFFFLNFFFFFFFFGQARVVRSGLKLLGPPMEEFILFGTPPPAYSLAFHSPRRLQLQQQQQQTQVHEQEEDAAQCRSNKKRCFDRVSDEPMFVEDDDEPDTTSHSKRPKCFELPRRQESAARESSFMVDDEQILNGKKKRPMDRMDPYMEDDVMEEDNNQEVGSAPKRGKVASSNDPLDEDEDSQEPLRRAHFLRLNASTRMCGIIFAFYHICSVFISADFYSPTSLQVD